ncbi:MAG: DMT family transporter [Firmicutes bacterium]|jgi:drug/metabolite transporter (DMT)-like permease|nr:DMT family transporter [Bacillota bacterium]
MGAREILMLCGSGFIHASWNALCKKGADKQAFLWLSVASASALLAVPAMPRVFLVSRPVVGLAFVSGLLQALYFLLLGKAYGSGGLSTVYPIARGSAPVFAALFGWALLKEIPSAPGAVGIALVAGGILAAHLGSSKPRPGQSPAGPAVYAILTGAVTAAYSAVDRVGVSLEYPPVYLFLVFAFACGALAPYMLTSRRERVLSEWISNRAVVAAVGVLSSLAYLLVLFALTSAKTAYVSAVREVSIVFATLLGVFVFKEPSSPSRLLGPLMIICGVACIGSAR